MSGNVLIDSNADRKPDYWVWEYGAGMEEFQYWTDIRMTEPDGHVSIITGL